MGFSESFREFRKNRALGSRLARVPLGGGGELSVWGPQRFSHVFERFPFQNPWGGVLYSGPPRLRTFTFTFTRARRSFTFTPDFPFTFYFYFPFTLLLLGRAFEAEKNAIFGNSLIVLTRKTQKRFFLTSPF